MRKTRVLFFLLLICTLTMSALPASSDDVAPIANDVFDYARMTLDGGMVVHFSAKTYDTVGSISVPTVGVQMKIFGDTYSTVYYVNAPTYVATNTSSYTHIKSYSGAITSGDHRMAALFEADGIQVAAFSNAIYFP